MRNDFPEIRKSYMHRSGKQYVESIHELLLIIIIIIISTNN